MNFAQVVEFLFNVRMLGAPFDPGIKSQAKSQD